MPDATIWTPDIKEVKSSNFSWLKYPDIYFLPQYDLQCQPARPFLETAHYVAYAIQVSTRFMLNITWSILLLAKKVVPADIVDRTVVESRCRDI